MEELAILTAMGVAALVWAMVLFVADVAGLCMGLGWRHYSKRRAQARLLKSKQDNG